MPSLSDRDGNSGSVVPAAIAYDRAWSVLVGASLCMFCGSPAVVYYTFGIFTSAVVADTHWSAIAIAAVIAPGAFIASAMSPVIGRLCDKFGVRTLAIIGGPLFALGLSLLGLLPTSARAFTGLTILMYLLSFAGSPILYAHILTGWFDRRRGLAISLMFACGALGIAAWPPLAAYLIAHFGWRRAYVVMGILAGSVTFLSGLLLLRNPPRSAAETGSMATTSGMLAGEAIRLARFWKIFVIFMLLSAVLAGTAVNFPVILRQHQADPRTAALTVSVIGIAMLMGRLSLGLVMDRWFVPRTTIAISIVPMFAFVLIITCSGKLALFAAAALLGFGLGSEYAVAAYFVSRAFGFRSFGTIYGFIQVGTNIGAAVGPAAIGVSLAARVNPVLIFTSAIAVLAVAILILLTLKRGDLPFARVGA